MSCLLKKDTRQAIGLIRKFEVPEGADRRYFFNPFSVEILRKVMVRILESYYVYPRKIQLFFYYPSDEHISYLMTVEEVMFADEIKFATRL